ncbi:hypothetical protein JCM3775_004248 [Rhodotorula graminis]|uniref:Uncharacterized protein n=1 Tax=Rhodotorula graminis (strain WP1) TaxID=578459 RepID=A0A194S7V7_RHOGW|nr:uncharacterized protein RHOBADRAFT_51803 [Rhodotorula graminis WP1]KPV76813.1 hypothetical protein RHOBADRAFT_51803 [Rhodotorula graminis WP1]
MAPVQPLPDVPSLFAHIRQPDPPPVDLAQPAPLAHERAAVRSLASTVQRGPASTFLHDVVLTRSHTLAVKHRKALDSKKKRTRSSNTSDDDDDDDLVLADKGFVHKRRTRSTDTDDDAPTTATATSGDRRAASRKTAALRTRRIKGQLVKPEVHLDDVDLPPGFPSHDLLTSLHSHASHLLTSTHNLVPPPSASTSRLPPAAQAHFDALEQRAQAQEARLARWGTDAELKAVKATRIRRKGAGTRRALWADADRAFEGPALVALGMLAELLVQDAAAAPGELPLPPPPAPAL